MEVHAFDTDNVEYKLNDILSAFNAMTFAVNGLMNLRLINNDQFAGLEYILRDAQNKAEALVMGLKPILAENDKRIVLLFCDESDENTEPDYAEEEVKADTH